MSAQPLRIGIVAGEASGDILGAGLIAAIKQRFPNAIIEGIGGPLMIEQGCDSHFAMEELSVMGLVEVLGRLRRLLHIRKQMAEYFISHPPDVFIGIDAPDFNLGLEQRLKATGIKTTHYVSPSVWAWRKKRIFKIKEAADLVLCLLPFETQIYHDHDIKAEFVGHTLADDIPAVTDTKQARAELNLPIDKPTLALLPGSRGSEIGMLAEPFLQAAVIIKQQFPDLSIVTPVVNEKRKAQFLEIKSQVAPDLPVTLIDGQPKGASRTAMSAADVVMLASGTATLEAALVKKPMIVAYRFKWLSYQIFKRLVKIPFFSLPNLVCDKQVVPELLQEQVTKEHIAQLACEYLSNPNDSLHDDYNDIHQLLKKDASKVSADAVLDLIESK